MRISDWSSDVCSSDLWELTFGRTGFGIPDPSYGFGGPLDARKTTLAEALEGMRGKTFHYLYDFGDGWEHSVKIQGIAPADPQGSYPRLLEATGMRSEEHTSELQSLMRISYAVFCLKKKNKLKIMQ